MKNNIEEHEEQYEEQRREELPCVWGHGWRLGRATPRPLARGQGQGQEELPGAVAAQSQEGLEELSHIEGKEGRQWGDTPRPR